MIVKTALHESILRHANEVYPQECCGIVVDGGYIPQDNVAENPTENFRMRESVWLEYAGRIEYVVHSHPNGPDCPSSTDIAQQIASGLPWMLVSIYENGSHGEVFTFGEKTRPPLIGRPFRHGVTDCFSLVMDSYALGVIEGMPDIEPKRLPDCPRDWGWWRDPDTSLYASNFQSWGFRLLDQSEEAKPWDAFLCSVGSVSGTPNHAILYCGGSSGLHHVGSWRDPYDPTRLSARENIGRWMATVSHRVRPTWIQV